MDVLNELLPKDLYHSYVIEGDPDIISEKLISLLKKRKEITKDGSNLFLGRYDSFTVSDSHKIRNWHSELSTADKNKKVCIISTQFINNDAERTLLKIIEEPKVNAHFFIIVPDSSILLDTIRSRVHTIIYPYHDEDGWLNKAEEFMNSSHGERISFIETMIKKYKIDENNSKLRAQSIKFINGIEKVAFQKFKKNKENKKIKFFLIEIQEKREFLNYPGSSVKMILEHLALMI